MATANDIPTWSVTGVCTEVRPLKTKKDNTVFAYVIKLMAMGGVYELQTRDEQLSKEFGEGITYACRGIFEHFNGAVRFVLRDVEAVA